MNLLKMLAVGSVLALAGGLLLILVFDGGAGWFAYAPASDADHFTISGGIIVTHRELFGFVLVAISAMLASALAGYRLGARRPR